MQKRAKLNSEPSGERDVNAKQFISSNRRARHEFEILKSYECGIVLAGTEVKSLRLGRIDFRDSFCKVENGEMWLYNMYISPYEQGNRYNLETRRKRKLLLHKREINQIQAEVEQKGLTIVPLSLFFQRGFAKLELAIARGKKLYDKRESIAERDRQREELRDFRGSGRED